MSKSAVLSKGISVIKRVGLGPNIRYLLLQSVFVFTEKIEIKEQQHYETRRTGNLCNKKVGVTSSARIYIYIYIYIYIHIYPSRPHDASNRNEYHVYFLGVKAAGA